MKKNLALLLLLTACVPATATTSSPIQDKHGLARQNMDITFKMVYGGDAMMTATASSGEVFHGRVITPRNESTGFGDSDGDSFYSSYGKLVEATNSSSHINTNTKYSDGARATLIGNKGHSMTCKFILSRPSQGITMGAVGECKISDGRIVPVSL